MTIETSNLPATQQCDLQTQVCEPGTEAITTNRRVLVPRADIFENDKEIVVLADLPGVDESSVDITVVKNILTITGSSQLEIPSGLRMSYCEFKLGDYQRRFTLPNEINRDSIQASMKNGVLRLTLPKSAESQIRKITVKSE